MKHDLSVVGIDLAKHVFPLVGMDDRGTILLRKRLMRGEVMAFMAKLPRVTVGREACGGTHDWARCLREQGHEVKLMAPQYVKPYVKTHKNDLRDAEASAEAATRPSRRFVPIKEVEHQDMQALPRVRERLMGARTALVNAMRGALGGVWHRVASRGTRVSQSGQREAGSRARQADVSEPGALLQAVGRGGEVGIGTGLLR